MIPKRGRCTTASRGGIHFYLPVRPESLGEGNASGSGTCAGYPGRRGSRETCDMSQRVPPTEHLKPF